MTNGYRKCNISRGGNDEWAPEKKPMLSIMSPQASLATNRTQPKAFQGSSVATALEVQARSNRRRRRPNTPTPRSRMTLSILITESGFSLSLSSLENRIQFVSYDFSNDYYFFSLVSSFVLRFDLFCRPRKIQERGEGWEG